MELLIFDVDGTLVDSSELTIAVVTEVVGQFSGLTLPGSDAIRDTFGLSEQDMWARLMPQGTTEQRQAASARYDARIVATLRGADVLLPHAREVLDELRGRGFTLTTASNCDTSYLDAVLDSQGIRDYFARPLCLGAVQGRIKADILTRHFEYFPKERAIMIGDRASDIAAAQTHGIPAIGCTFGFGTNAELVGAVKRIDVLTELLQILPVQS